MTENGYMGKGLRINLTERNAVEEDFSKEDQRKYLGGQSLGVKTLYEELDPGIDPLSPENKLFFATGPLNGTLTPLAKGHVTLSKSPLSNTICKSSSGGMFGAELKQTGYDYVIIEGKAENQTYISISNGEVQFKNANDLWGKTVFKTENLIKKQEKNDIRRANQREVKVACIGPAGGNLVRYASIMNEKHNASGRGGLGAVMGSKNLKAIAVRGTKDINVNDLKSLARFRKNIIESMEGTDFGEDFSRFGTTETVPVTNLHGIYPTRNFQEGVFKPYDTNFDPSKIRNDLVVREKGCFGCPIHCNKVVDVNTSVGDLITDRQEFETFFSLGGNCGNPEIEENILAGHICNKLGMDTISTGVSISFALELAQRNIIEKEKDDLDLEWGNNEAILSLIKKIAYREEFGDLLAEGSARAAQELSDDAEKYSMTVKGMELPGYDPRGAKGIGLTYAVSSRGACHKFAYPIRDEMWTHNIDRFKEEEKPELVKELSDTNGVANSAIICTFPIDQGVFEWEEIKEAINHVTGFEYTENDLKRIGERTINLERLFNIREGFSKENDTLPDRFLEEPLQGPSKGETVDLEKMLKEYYEVRGWDTEGKPKQEKLEELNLESEV